MHLNRDAYDQGNGREMDRLVYWYYRADMTDVYRYEPSTHQYFYGGAWSTNPPLDATNKLAYVEDSEGETHDTDLDNQNANNYSYNEIGELTNDAAEGLTTDWTVYHKVDQVSFSNNLSLAGIDFGYGPMQQRVRTTLIPNSGPGATTFYVRDAQGNVMSVYRAELDGNYWVTTQTELPIYGSDRLGQQLADRQVKKVFNYDPQGNSGDSPLRGMLVLAEVNYDSPSGNGFGEYISLKNVGEEEIDLDGVSLGAGGVSYLLPAGSSILPGEYLLVANGTSGEQAGFLLVNGLDATLLSETEVVWQTVLGLSDKGGSLRLFDEEGLTVDELVFGGSGILAANATCDAVCQADPMRDSVKVAQRIDTSVPAVGSFDSSLWGVREATGTGAKLKKSLVAVRGLGEKVYELKDHLGNVRVVVSDRKLSTMVGTDPVDFLADVRELKDYFAFGMLQPGQAAEPGGVDGYRYGFNGMERDDELKGSGRHVCFGDFGYDPVVARRLRTEPKSTLLPQFSPFIFGLNSPIQVVDPDGKFPILINGKVADKTERGSFIYWDLSVLRSVSENTGYSWYSFRFVDGDQGMWPNDRKEEGKAQAKLDAQGVWNQMKESLNEEGKITEQLQIISHSRGSAFAAGYMHALSVEIRKLADNEGIGFAYDDVAIIEYSVNLAPHQSNYIDYANSGTKNVNISHIDDMLSGNDATGDVINVHSPVGDAVSSHGNGSFVEELNGILKILEKQLNKDEVESEIRKFYQVRDKQGSRNTTIMKGE